MGDRAGSSPVARTRGVFVSLSHMKQRDSVNTDFVSFNYHFPLEELSLVTSRGVCGLRKTLYKEAK